MKAVIFGAGEIGAKVRKIFENEGLEVLCYMDNSEKKWGTEFDGLPVRSPKELHDMAYDVLGIGALKAAETIKNQLIGMGVDPAVIRIPITTTKISLNREVPPDEEYYLEGETASQLKNRPDIVLRYLLLKQGMFDGRLEDALLDAFRACFADGEKAKREIQRVIPSLLETEMPLKNREKQFGKKLKQLAEDDSRWRDVYDGASLKDQRFYDLFQSVQSFDHRLELINAYMDLSRDVRLLIAIGADSEAFRDISVIGDIELDFERNYIGFMSFVGIVKRNYRKETYVFSNAELKEAVKYPNLTVKIVLADNSDLSGVQSGNTITVESPEDIRYVRQHILHPESLKFVRDRLPICEEARFLDILDELKGKMEEFNVPLEKVCVVGGGSLQAYGIRTATDIDLIITDDLRSLYGDGLVIVSDHVEIHHRDEFDVADHDIVTHPRHYFYYYGVKFMGLDILHRKRKRTGSSDARMIELFQMYRN